MKYRDLPFIENINMPRVEFGPAAALRGPLAHAINSARHLPEHAMDDVIAILRYALDHVGAKEAQASEPISEDTDLSDLDVAASLLGAAEDESDPG